MRHEIEITKTADEDHTLRITVHQINNDGVKFIRDINEFGPRAFNFIANHFGTIYEGATFTKEWDFGRARTLRGKIRKALEQA